MNFGNISMIIDDLPVEQKYKHDRIAEHLSNDEKYTFTLLHTTAKFEFASYLTQKITDCVLGEGQTRCDDFYDDMICDVPNEVIDYFLGDFSKWKRIFGNIANDEKIQEAYNNRIVIVKNKY